MYNIEICCDASIKTYECERTFGCAGAVLLGTNEKRYKIIPDCTNNIAELEAMITAIKFAHELIMCGMNTNDIIIYSDSKFVVFGLKYWMNAWLNNMDRNGTIYNSSNEPVKNQEYFLYILNYLMVNNLKVRLKHQKGHVSLHNEQSLQNAIRVYHKSNGGSLLTRDDIYKISYYNDMIDKFTRSMLQQINPMEYNKRLIPNQNIMAKYIIPMDYRKFIL